MQKDLLFLLKQCKVYMIYGFHNIKQSNFKKIIKVLIIREFNPNKIQTSREKYVIVNKLAIFDSIFIKI